MIETLIQGALTGALATIGMDIWAAVAKHVLRLPTANWALVGRWFGHMPRGVFVHLSIADAAPVQNELAIGWIAHYFTGIVYGIAYLTIVGFLVPVGPSLISALVFALVTLIAPWLIIQPGMGAGVFASRTQCPNLVRLINLSMHGVFGVCLYSACVLAQQGGF
jgi:Protein of unknown function (DUF2938)